MTTRVLLPRDDEALKKERKAWDFSDMRERRDQVTRLPGHVERSRFADYDIDMDEDDGWGN